MKTICTECGAKCVNGIPTYEPKTSQQLTCINLHVKKVMDRLREMRRG